MNKHDDRLNKLEQWLDTYGEDAAVVLAVRAVLAIGADDHAYSAKYRALRDLANIVGVGLEDLEGP